MISVLDPWWNKCNYILVANCRDRQVCGCFDEHHCLTWFTLLFFSFFSVRLVSVLRGHSFLSSPPQRPKTSEFEGFSIPDCIHYICFPVLILEKEPVFPCLMFNAKQGNYLVPFFITYLVWRGPWHGIEPWTSRTRCQHSTTRLSRRRYVLLWFTWCLPYNMCCRWS